MQQGMQDLHSSEEESHAAEPQSPMAMTRATTAATAAATHAGTPTLASPTPQTHEIQSQQKISAQLQESKNEFTQVGMDVTVLDSRNDNDSNMNRVDCGVEGRPSNETGGVKEPSDMNSASHTSQEHNPGDVTANRPSNEHETGLNGQSSAANSRIKDLVRGRARKPGINRLVSSVHRSMDLEDEWSDAQAASSNSNRSTGLGSASASSLMHLPLILYTPSFDPPGDPNLIYSASSDTLSPTTLTQQTLSRLRRRSRSLDGCSDVAGIKSTAALTSNNNAITPVGLSNQSSFPGMQHVHKQTGTRSYANYFGMKKPVTSTSSVSVNPNIMLLPVPQIPHVSPASWMSTPKHVQRAGTFTAQSGSEPHHAASQRLPLTPETPMASVRRPDTPTTPATNQTHGVARPPARSSSLISRPPKHKNSQVPTSTPSSVQHANNVDLITPESTKRSSPTPGYDKEPSEPELVPQPMVTSPVNTTMTEPNLPHTIDSHHQVTIISLESDGNSSVDDSVGFVSHRGPSAVPARIATLTKRPLSSPASSISDPSTPAKDSAGATPYLFGDASLPWMQVSSTSSGTTSHDDEAFQTPRVPPMPILKSNDNIMTYLQVSSPIETSIDIGPSTPTHNNNVDIDEELRDSVPSLSRTLDPVKLRKRQHRESDLWQLQQLQDIIRSENFSFERFDASRGVVSLERTSSLSKLDKNAGDDVVDTVTSVSTSLPNVNGFEALHGGDCDKPSVVHAGAGFVDTTATSSSVAITSTSSSTGMPWVRRARNALGLNRTNSMRSVSSSIVSNTSSATYRSNSSTSNKSIGSTDHINTNSHLISTTPLLSPSGSIGDEIHASMDTSTMSPNTTVISYYASLPSNADEPEVTNTKAESSSSSMSPLAQTSTESVDVTAHDATITTTATTTTTTDTSKHAVFKLLFGAKDQHREKPDAHKKLLATTLGTEPTTTDPSHVAVVLAANVSTHFGISTHTPRKNGISGTSTSSTTSSVSSLSFSTSSESSLSSASPVISSSKLSSLSSLPFSASSSTSSVVSLGSGGSNYYQRLRGLRLLGGKGGSRHGAKATRLQQAGDAIQSDIHAAYDGQDPTNNPQWVSVNYDVYDRSWRPNVPLMPTNWSMADERDKEAMVIRASWNKETC